jgi:hypothetical protein
MNKEGLELVSELNQYIIELEKKNKILINQINNLQKSISLRRSP